MKKKILFVLASLMLMGTSAMAQSPENFTEFEADGIHYVFRNNFYGIDGLSVWVTSTAGWGLAEDETNTYSGDIVIPSTIIYNDKEYPVMGIYSKAFHRCTINSLTLSEGVKYIPTFNRGSCFDNTYIKAIHLPSTFTVEKTEAFLNEVNGYRFFYGCINLETIEVAAENPEFDSRDNCNALIETATNTLWDGCKTTIIPSSVETIGAMAFAGSDIEKCIISEGVKKIEGNVFYDCSKLVSVDIPSSVNVIIGTLLFQNCRSLTSIKIPQTALIRSAEGYEGDEEIGTKVIPSSMFGGCASFREFVIPDGVMHIGTSAFNGCESLLTITIPSSVTNIEGLAFKGCNRMNCVTLLSRVPPTIKESSFRNLYDQITLNVPEGAEQAYKQHEVWGLFFDKEISVTGITLDKTTAELTEGETTTLVATVTPDNATDKTVTWTTSDETVATVKDGIVTTLKAGEVTITAKVGDKTATCTIAVKAKVIAVTGITLDKTTAELTEGETITLVATVTPDNAADKTVTWTTSDASVATVTNGEVSAVKAGTATITAKAGDKSATCTITVKAKEVVEVPENPEVPKDAFYFWQSAAGTVVETGGVATGHGAGEGRVNYANGDYHTLSISVKKANIDTDYILITLDQPLAANDKLEITAYRNKDTDANGTLYILFENGHVIDEGDNVVWNNIALGQEPNTNTYAVGEGAGSKTIKLSRSKSSTNVFITKFVITRTADGIEEIEMVVPTEKTIYNLQGQKIDASSIDALPAGLYIVNGKKMVIR